MENKVQKIMDLIREKNIQMVDFKMVDISGQYRHVSILAKDFDESVMKTASASMLPTMAMPWWKRAIWCSFPILIPL